MKDRIVKDWNISRILRSLLGLAAIAYAIYSGQYLFLIIGALFIVQSILNLSCCSCGTQACGDENRNKKGIYKDHIKEYKPK